jgi:flagellar motor switch protein FliN
MMGYIDYWIPVARTLFAEALTGEAELIEAPSVHLEAPGVGFVAKLGGSVAGQLGVVLDPAIFAAPLLGDGVDQKAAWGELLRGVADAAAGELFAKTGRKCAVAEFSEMEAKPRPFRAFQLRSSGGAWSILLQDEVHSEAASPPIALSPGVELLLDVELEASLRFGCREVSLGEVLDLGPGDVVELDRLVVDPVDLIVGDKIVARGEVVLVDGNFGLRVTEVATPRKRLESIRCLF